MITVPDPYGQTDRRSSDRRITVASPRSASLASRGKDYVLHARSVTVKYKTYQYKDAFVLLYKSMNGKEPFGIFKLSVVSSPYRVGLTEKIEKVQK